VQFQNAASAVSIVRQIEGRWRDVTGSVQDCIGPEQNRGECVLAYLVGRRRTLEVRGSSRFAEPTYGPAPSQCAIQPRIPALSITSSRASAAMTSRSRAHLVDQFVSSVICSGISTVQGRVYAFGSSTVSPGRACRSSAAECVPSSLRHRSSGCRHVQPKTVSETVGTDHQRVAFPCGSRVPVPGRIGILRQRSTIDEDPAGTWHSLH
jgi:hypothetical protein